MGDVRSALVVGNVRWPGDEGGSDIRRVAEFAGCADHAAGSTPAPTVARKPRICCEQTGAVASETNEAIADLSKIPASQDQRQAMCDHCGDAIHETREQYEARVREYVIQLEDEARYEAIIDEDKARYAEWTWDYQQGHGEAA